MNKPRWDFSGVGPFLYQQWQRLSQMPGGSWLFGRVVGALNPYTGSVSPQFLELSPGHAKVALDEHRAIRNHVGSIHAIALINVAEVTMTLALMAGLPADARAIPTGLSIEYLKKARGRVVARCDCQVPADNTRRELHLESMITDEQGDVVARAAAKVLVGPKKLAR